MEELWKYFDLNLDRMLDIIKMVDKKCSNSLEERIAFVHELVIEGTISTMEGLFVSIELGYDEGHLAGEKSKLADLWRQPQYSN